MAAVRDGLGEKVDDKAQIRELKARRAAQQRSSGTSDQGSGASSADDIMALIKERWQPLTVLAASLLAMAMMIRRLSAK